LEYTLPFILPDLELAVGPYEAASVRLEAPASLKIQFVYESGYTGAACDAGREPGSDPGAPESFDFKHIISVDPMVLTSSTHDLRLVVQKGADIYSLLTNRELQEIELELLKRHRLLTQEAKVDQVLARRAAQEALP
jgi:hypothetical protein